MEGTTALESVQDEHSSADTRWQGATCWTEAWWHPWASVWCLIERWRYANAAGTGDLWRVFGGASKPVAQVRIAKLNPDSLRMVFGHPVDGSEETLFRHLERPLIHGKTLRRPYLMTCPQCLAVGFHSPFHQFGLWDCCPFHGVGLESICLHCGAQRPYGLLKTNGTPPFGCRCGAMSVIPCDRVGGFLQQWTEARHLALQVSSIRSWVTMPAEVVRRLRRAGISEDGMPDQSGTAVEALLDVACRLNPRIPEGFAWSGLTVGPGIRHFTGTNPVMPGPHAPKHSPFGIHQDLYHTFKCLSRRLRRTVLRCHRNCILNQQQSPWRVICPYAAAYLHWRNEVECWPRMAAIDRGPRIQVGLGQWILPLTDWRSSVWTKSVRDPIERRPWTGTCGATDGASREENVGNPWFLWALHKQFALMAAIRFRQWLTAMVDAQAEPYGLTSSAKPKPPQEWRWTVVMMPDPDDQAPAVMHWIDHPSAADTAGIWGAGSQGDDRRRHVCYGAVTGGG